MCHIGATRNSKNVTTENKCNHHMQRMTLKSDAVEETGVDLGQLIHGLKTVAALQHSVHQLLSSSC